MFALPPRTPFRWGTSPFHASGASSTTRSSRSPARRSPARRLRAIRQTGDAALEAFLAQRFSTLEWYDTLPLIYLSVAVARCQGFQPQPAHPRRRRGACHPRVDRIQRSGPPPRFHRGRRDLASARIGLVPRLRRKPNRRSSGSGTSAACAGGCRYAWSKGGPSPPLTSSRRCSRMSGAHGPRAHALDAEPDGAQEGHPLYRITFDITWVF